MASRHDRLAEVIEKYRMHPEFLGIDITDPNQRGALDDTLLHLAARKGAIEDIRALVDAGADVNVAGDLGNTPLHHAAMTRQVGSARVLLELGARRDMKNEFDQTPFQVAELNSCADMLRLLKR
jgi:ankyrin repeat protein